ncbi:NB-ARC domain-containing protein [Haloactinospora alba]|uniref:NB-ARC domain-containing protein n=1 Tax=Haloactinospora alba TaxID=405555 RepID=A0A543NL85_9ACTN|nr:tetratricopeptide repeat protein [Haloactinospora alba]TQN32582.1 NB-ARC domain-containing protein [Haloactinospora alba]
MDRGDGRAAGGGSDGAARNDLHGNAETAVQIQNNTGAVNIRTGGQADVPLEVPPEPPHFVDRTAALAKAETVLGRGDTTNVLVLDGAPGIGKTALIRKCAAQFRERFPGGQIHVTYDTGSRAHREDPDRWVTIVLRRLGVADEYLPSTYEGRVNQLRSRLARSAALVVIEGATDPAQVRPFLSNAPGSGVLVTSDGPALPELELDGARSLALEPLDSEAGRELLLAMGGDAAAAAGSGILDRLVAACDGLPLALATAARRMARCSPRGLEPLAEELEDEKQRLAALAPEGQATTVSAVLGVSYGQLSAPAAALYRALSSWPCPRVGVSVAAALGDTDPGSVRALSEELTGANLLESDGSDHYRFRHSLIRLDARERATRTESEEQRSAAFRRGLEDFLAMAAFADRVVMGERLRIVDTAAWTGGRSDPFGADDKRALRWLEEERETLREGVRAAARAGMHDHAWQLAELATALYLNVRYVTDWADTGTAGADAAQAAGNARAEARLRSLASRPLTDLGRWERAQQEIERALRAAEDAELLLRASVQEFHGRYLEYVDPDSAIAAYDRCQRLNERVAEHDAYNGARGAALAVYFRGRAFATSGREDDAIAAAGEAMERFLALSPPDERMAARARASLGYAYSRAGRLAEASRELGAAVEALRAGGRTYYQAEAERELADVLARLGAPAAALPHLRNVLAVYTAGGNPQAREVRDRLAELNG